MTQRPVYRQLPDGTWLNETTGTVSAPLQPRMGGSYQKRGQAPAMTPVGASFTPPQIDTNARMLQGGLAGYGALPGQWNMHMPHGRNYPALGAYVDAPSYQAVGLLDRMSPMMKGVILLGGIVGIATLTVYFNKKK